MFIIDLLTYLKEKKENIKLKFNQKVLNAITNTRCMEYVVYFKKSIFSKATRNILKMIKL